MLQLKAFNCTKCGGTLDFAADGLRAKCKYCGTEHFFKEDKEESLVMSFNIAGEYLKKNLFDDAIAHYAGIMKEYPNDSEAAWGYTVSTYGIVYARDDRTDSMVATCSRIVKGSILDFPAYKTAIVNCADEQRPIYEKEAQNIDRLQKRIKRAMEDEEDFDVFISFKAKDSEGAVTEDSVIARNIYEELTKKGIKAFFSSVTLAGRMGDEYEPIIYRALYSCKFFILVGTKEEYIEAPWVKNEWTRFRDRMDEENLGGVFSAVFRGDVVSSLPRKLQTQGVDLAEHPYDYATTIANNLAIKFGIVDVERDRINAALEAERRKNEEERRKSEEAQREMERKMREMEEQLKKARASDAALVISDATPIAPKVGKSSNASGTEGIVYNLSQDRRYATVLGCSTDTSGDVVIAAEYAGKPVKAIEENAFYQCENITSVIVPDSVTSIGNWAFSLCGSLKSVIIGSGVTAIEDTSFSHCDSLQSIKVSENNLKYKDIDGNLYTKDGKTFLLYANGKKAESFIVPKGVTKIVSHAFYCEYLKSVAITDDVAVILDSAFSDCFNLTSVTIGSGVTTIGNSAFSCYSLTSIKVSADNTRYKDIDGNLYTKDGKNLIQYAEGKADTGFTIPNGVVKISYQAFYSCRNLTNVTIPDSVIEIGEGAFRHCENLKNLDIPNSVNKIGTGAFENSGLTTVTIGNSVNMICEGAFQYCENLKTVIYRDTEEKWKKVEIRKSNKSLRKAEIKFELANPDGFAVPKSTKSEPKKERGSSGLSYAVSEDGKYAIVIKCERNATDVVIASEYQGLPVKEIKKEAFNCCANITSVTIPDSVTTIGNCAFYKCTGLTTVTIGNGVTTINNSAFRHCTSLTSITVDEGNTAYKDIDGNLCTKDGKTLIKYARGKKDTSFTIPDSVTSIGDSAFDSCTNLTGVTIPDSVTSIGSFAFSSCDNLTSVTIGNSVTSIGCAAFSGCTGLTGVTIGNSVTSIGYAAFSGCTGLTSVTIPDSVTEIGDSAFEGCANLTNIAIGNSVTTIGESAFFGCTNLTSVTFCGTKVQWKDIFIEEENDILGKVVIHCTDGKINLHVASTSAPAANNLSISASKSATPVKQPAIKPEIAGDSEYLEFELSKNGGFYKVSGCDEKVVEVVIPKDYKGKAVEEICSYAFSNCSRLTRVTIPNSVISIDGGAFSNCTGLTIVTIPNSVTSIGCRSFHGCIGIKNVTFEGTKLQWKKIAIEKGNDILKKATIHCTDGDIKPAKFLKIFN